jgi:hypothetical protein
VLTSSTGENKGGAEPRVGGWTRRAVPPRLGANGKPLGDRDWLTGKRVGALVIDRCLAGHMEVKVAFGRESTVLTLAEGTATPLVELKRLVADATGVLILRQKLLFAGQDLSTLDGTRSVGSAGLKPGCKVLLLATRPMGAATDLDLSLNGAPSLPPAYPPPLEEQRSTATVGVDSTAPATPPHAAVVPASVRQDRAVLHAGQQLLLSTSKRPSAGAAPANSAAFTRLERHRLLCVPGHERNGGLLLLLAYVGHLV